MTRATHTKQPRSTHPTSTTQTADLVIAGVDTHADTHRVTVLASDGRLLGDGEFPSTLTGYQQLLAWMLSFGVLVRVGIELTGAYGAGLTRFLQAEDIDVVDVNTTNRQARARHGKNDQLDSEQAARQALAGVATTVPKDRTGIVEAIRMLLVVRRSAVKARTVALQNIRDLLITAPDTIRDAFRDDTGLHAKAVRAARLRPDLARIQEPEQAVKLALKRLGQRVAQLTDEITAADADLDALTMVAAPQLRAEPSIGPQTSAQLLVTHGHRGRVKDAASFARLCGTAPVPMSSGKTHRNRLHRGGDRQANHALYMIVIGRLQTHPESQAFAAKKEAEGFSRRDVIRALKCYLAKKVYRLLENGVDRP